MRALLALVAALIAMPSLAAERAPRLDRVAQCSWDRPGHNPFMGEVVPAIDRYIDIPTPVRMRLKQRMAQRRYDDLVEIRRDSIRGKHDYASEIRDMHFGLDRVCGQVTRGAWSASMRERGLVYCDSGHCILVPTVCRNVSRIERRKARAAAATGEQDLSAQALDFDPPSAGGSAAPDSFAAAAAPPAPMGSAAGDSAQEAGPALPGSPWLAGGWGGSGPGSAGSGGGAPGFEGGAGFGGGGPIVSGGGNGLPLGTGSEGVGLPPMTAPVPEPSTWALMALGLLAVIAASRRRRSP